MTAPETHEKIFNVVVGTAGHIDHGKSTLVQALTGIHPDRLKEEQERGITIDLGFAPLELKNGLRIGIIDVPGHERFIKNMVAGATGIDFVIMVIAADDGVMAQTREHLQIVQLLGVRDGLTVITKKDLAEPDYLSLVIEDVKALEVGTVLENKPILPLSAKTGEGIEALKAVLEEALGNLTRRPSSGPFRMPIQRVFAKEGFGTVVTGVPLSGQITIGDTLEILPPAYEGRVKGLHAYKHAITHGQAGHSTAVNLHGPGIDKQQVVRGMVAVTPGVFQATSVITARLELLAGIPWPLKHRASVRFHAGTAEIQGKVLLLECEQMAPKTSGWVQIFLAEKTVLAPGDRFILRLQTPMITLGGGRVVDVSSVKRKRMAAEVMSELNARWKVIDQPNEFLAHLLSSSDGPRTIPELSAECGWLPEQVVAGVNDLIAKKRAVALRPGAAFIATNVLNALGEKLITSIQDFLREHPALGSIELPELRRRLEIAAGARAGGFCDDLIAYLKLRGEILAESNTVALPGRERKLEGALAQKAQQVEETFAAGGLTPPAPGEVEGQLKIPSKTFREIMKYLLETGRLFEAASDVCFHQSVFEKAKSETLSLFAKGPEWTTSEIRQHLGMNRKFVVPLVELFDRQKVTVRVGDKRRLAEK